MQKTTAYSRILLIAVVISPIYVYSLERQFFVRCLLWPIFYGTSPFTNGILFITQTIRTQKAYITTKRMSITDSGILK